MTENAEIWEDVTHLAPNTVRSYRSVIETHFTGRDVSNPDHVLTTLREMHDKGIGQDYFRVLSAAVTTLADMQGKPSGAKDPRVRQLIGSYGRNDVSEPVKKKPLLPDHVLNVSHLLKERDQMLLLLGIAGGFRRSELVAIRVEDIRRDMDTGLFSVFVPKAKRGSRTVQLPVTFGLRIQRYAAQQAERGHTYLFPGRDQGRGHIGERSVALLVKKVAKLNGLDPADYSGHSLRSGYILSALQNGWKDWEVAAQTGHSNTTTLQGYVQESDVPDVFNKRDQ